MSEGIALNATVGGLSGLASISPSTISPSTWMSLIAFCLTIGIGVTLFMVWRNFRRVIVGLGISLPIALLGYGSWSITKPAGEGNWKPLLITLGVIGGLFLMMLIGKIAENFKPVKDFEKRL
jgi:hypothetical protein